MTIVNFKLSGDLEKFVEKYIRKGYATSKTEVLRQGLIKMKDSIEYDDLSDDPELLKHLLDVKSGKTKARFKGPISSLDELIK